MTIGNLLIVMGAIVLIIAGLLFFFVSERYKIGIGAASIAAIALIITGFILKRRAGRVEPFQDSGEIPENSQDTVPSIE